MKREFLLVRELRRELKRLKEDLTALDEVLYVPSGYVLDDMPKAKGGALSFVLEGILKREEVKEKYEETLKAYFTQKERLEKVISERLGENEAAVLREYYLRGRTWREVSEALGLSESWMFKLHRRAFETLKESITS